jgi:hypothetical protein
MAGLLLGELGLSPADVPRFRDCYIDRYAAEIVIYTRVGGGNRDDYTAGIAQLRAHPLFRRDDDDRTDATYANFRFAIPERHRDVLLLIADKFTRSAPAELWAQALADLDAGRDTPATRRSRAVGERIIRQLDGAPSGTIIKV